MDDFELLIGVAVIFLFIGFYCGIEIQQRECYRQALNRGCAIYNSETGKLQYINKVNK